MKWSHLAILVLAFLCLTRSHAAPTTPTLVASTTGDPAREENESPTVTASSPIVSTATKEKLKSAEDIAEEVISIEPKVSDSQSHMKKPESEKKLSQSADGAIEKEEKTFSYRPLRSFNAYDLLEKIRAQQEEEERRRAQVVKQLLTSFRLGTIAPNPREIVDGTAGHDHSDYKPYLFGGLPTSPFGPPHQIPISRSYPAPPNDTPAEAVPDETANIVNVDNIEDEVELIDPVQRDPRTSDSGDDGEYEPEERETPMQPSDAPMGPEPRAPEEADHDETDVPIIIPHIHVKAVKPERRTLIITVRRLDPAASDTSETSVEPDSSEGGIEMPSGGVGSVDHAEPTTFQPPYMNPIPTLLSSIFGRRPTIVVRSSSDEQPTISSDQEEESTPASACSQCLHIPQSPTYGGFGGFSNNPFGFFGGGTGGLFPSYPSYGHQIPSYFPSFQQFNPFPTFTIVVSHPPPAPANPEEIPTEEGKDGVMPPTPMEPEGGNGEKPEGESPEKPEGESPEKPEGESAEKPEEPEGESAEKPEGELPTSGGPEPGAGGDGEADKKDEGEGEGAEEAEVSEEAEGDASTSDQGFDIKAGEEADESSGESDERK